MERWTHRSMEENKNPEVDPQYVQLIYDKGAEAIQWRKGFNKWCFSNWISIGLRKMNLKPNLKLQAFNSKWIVDLNVKCKNI